MATLENSHNLKLNKAKSQVLEGPICLKDM